MKKIQFETVMSHFERVNPEFMRVKVNVCYADENRNYSDIPQDVLDDMSKTIYGVPVVGELDEEGKKFKGHGGKLEISDDGWKETKTTIPYGFVDPTTPVFYEDVLERDGMTVNKYLSCYAYLWVGRYPVLPEVFENKVGQSMEIIVEDGNWREDGYFQVKKARFQALCLLGVEPCFESAKATVGYSLEESESTFNEMMDVFKQYTLETLGGEQMDNATEVLEETVEVVEETVVEETIEAEVVDEIAMEESTEESTEEVIEAEETTDEVSEVETDEVVESTEEEFTQVEEEAPVVEEIDYKAKYEELEIAFGKLSQEYEELKTDHARLAEFEKVTLVAQREAEEIELFARFEHLIGFDGFDELKASAHKYSIKDLELNLFALAGRKFSAVKPAVKKPSVAKLKVGASAPVTSGACEYSHILDKYKR